MKRYAWVIVGMLAAASVMVGCGKKNEVDTSKLESNFQSADPSARGTADKAVGAIKAGNYSEAMTSLQKLSSQAKLTPEQKKAIQDVIAQVQQQMTDAANKAAAGAQKSAQDLKKSLPLK